MKPMHCSTQSHAFITKLPRRLIVVGLPGMSLWAQEASAARGRWDGTSSARNSCALGDEGRECRAANISGGDEAFTSSYSDAAKSERKAPVQSAVSKENYALETRQLMQSVLDVSNLDPFDEKRMLALDTVQKEGRKWSASYAPGGRASSQSARAAQTALSALLGHLAFQGPAPLPKPLQQKCVEAAEEALTLLAEGK